MKNLNDTIFICASTYRSRAYAQAMINTGIVPEHVIYLRGDEPIWNGVLTYSLNLDNNKSPFIFSPGEPASTTFKNAGIPVHIAPSKDVNTPEFLKFLKQFNQEVAIYSGFGGVILRNPLLSIGKKFLHVHGGYAPSYRGSTAFYYSLLKEGTLASTALWLEENIDTGPIISRKTYTAIDDVDIDLILDPCVRADLLQDILIDREMNSAYPKGFYDNEDAFTYFVIHPLLKHIALKKYGILP